MNHGWLACIILIRIYYRGLYPTTAILLANLPLKLHLHPVTLQSMLLLAHVGLRLIICKRGAYPAIQKWQLISHLNEFVGQLTPSFNSFFCADSYTTFFTREEDFYVIEWKIAQNLTQYLTVVVTYNRYRFNMFATSRINIIENIFLYLVVTRTNIIENRFLYLVVPATCYMSLGSTNGD